METDKKTIRLMTAKNITIVVISILVTIVAVVLSFVFDLYGYIGTVGGVVINALIFFGVFGALEIDDWTIWLKRIIIKKYKDKKGKLIIKVYDKNLTKKWLTVPVLNIDYLVTNDQTIVWNLRMFSKSEVFVIEASINPITNGVTIVDHYGKTYKCGKEQFTYSGERLDVEMTKFNSFLRNYTGERVLYSFNPDSLTLELDK